MSAREGVSGMCNQVKAMRHTQDMLERLYPSIYQFLLIHIWVAEQKLKQRGPDLPLPSYPLQLFWDVPRLAES